MDGDIISAASACRTTTIDMTVFTLLVSVMYFLNVTPCHAGAVKDMRRLPITHGELTNSVQQLPLSSPLQLQDLLRASHSGLLDVAYALYTQRWQQAPHDANANLLRGLSAELFWEASMNLTQRQQYGLKTSRDDLFTIATNCLKQAATEAPDCARAEAEYGYWQWQFRVQEVEGLARLRKAAALDPSDARIHATLGLVYSNATGNAYSIPKAIHELQLAIKEDPSYAYPHALLADIYREQGMTAQEQAQKHIYQSLQPL